MKHVGSGCSTSDVAKLLCSDLQQAASGDSQDSDDVANSAAADGALVIDESLAMEGKAEHCLPPNFEFEQWQPMCERLVCYALCMSAEWKLSIMLVNVAVPDLNCVYNHAGAVLEVEEDFIEIDDSSSPLIPVRQLLGSSDAQCSVYEFVQHLLWPDTCAMQDSYHSR